MLERIVDKLRQMARRTAPTAAARGRWGEDLAENHLRRTRGFRTICRNWRHGRDEMDLIGWENGILVFVEVRTRPAHALVPGFFTLDKRKRKALRRCCLAFLQAMPHPPQTYRCDLVEVRHQDGADPECLHYEAVTIIGDHWLPSRLARRRDNTRAREE